MSVALYVCPSLIKLENYLNTLYKLSGGYFVPQLRLVGARTKSFLF